MSDEKSEDELWGVFGIVRAQVIELAQDFADRVSMRIDEYVESGEFGRPSLSEAMARFVLDVTNMLGAAVGAKKAQDDEREDDDSSDDEGEGNS